MQHYKVGRNFLLCSLPFFMTSCASILNRPITVVTVHTQKPAQIIYNLDTLKTVDNKVHLAVPRHRRSLNLSSITDSLTTQTAIKSRNSAAFYGNLWFNLGLPGLVIDWNNPKRYTYPKKVYLNADNTFTPDYKMRHIPKRGDWNLIVSLPHINAFRFKPYGKKVQDHAGFLGFAAGVDYYYSPKKFLNFTTGAITDFLVPFPAPVDHFDNYEQMNAVYATVSDNYKFNRFTVGYGLSVSQNTWAIREGMGQFEPGQPLPESESHTAVGAVVSSYLQVGRRLHLGLVYRPSIFRPGSPEVFEYEHTISFDIAWKFQL